MKLLQLGTLFLTSKNNKNNFSQNDKRFHKIFVASIYYSM